ncbi:hypothetical protein ON010_g18741 [Phytophthora cinnamomi]|nr:hypothetical protein ON010_g18741 [Phytophthora cinnamomi]
MHGPCLKFYYASSLDVMTELNEYVTRRGIVMVVQAIVNHREKTASNAWEVQFAWGELEDVNNLCEPLPTIYADVPIKAQEYVATNAIANLDLRRTTPIPED